MAEREGFEPSMELLAPYSLSRGAPSAARPSLLRPFALICDIFKPRTGLESTKMTRKNLALYYKKWMKIKRLRLHRADDAPLSLHVALFLSH
ncbi:MAG: hypothetical protein RLZ35_842 [Pseudomonadota bacterium]